jgi:hypothetical protein
MRVSATPGVGMVVSSLLLEPISVTIRIEDCFDGNVSGEVWGNIPSVGWPNTEWHAVVGTQQQGLENIKVVLLPILSGEHSRILSVLVVRSKRPCRKMQASSNLPFEQSTA